MNAFEVPAGLLRVAINGIIATTSRTLSSNRRTMLPPVVEAIERDVKQLEQIARHLELVPTEKILTIYEGTAQEALEAIAKTAKSPK